jgi:hypothetical protein
MLSGLWHNDQPEIDYLDINYVDALCKGLWCIGNQIGKRSRSPVPEQSRLDEEMEVGITAAWSQANILPPRKACSGKAGRELKKLGVKRMNTIREHMLKRFGAGKPDALTERVMLYLLGMPDPNGVPFPP